MKVERSKEEDLRIAQLKLALEEQKKTKEYLATLDIKKSSINNDKPK